MDIRLQLSGFYVRRKKGVRDPVNELAERIRVTHAVKMGIGIYREAT